MKENTVTGKKVEVVYQIFGDYVAFHEMSGYVNYELGVHNHRPPEQMGPDYIGETLTEEQWTTWKDLTVEEQDKQVEAWINSYESDGHGDMAIVSAIKIGKDYYVEP